MLSAFSTLLAFIVALSPGIIGSSVGYLYGTRFSNDAPGATCVYMGIGGVLGFLIVSAACYLSLSLGLVPFTFSVATMMALMTSVTITACYRVYSKHALLIKRPMAAKPLIFFILLCVGFTAYQSIKVPTHAWDGITFWSHWAEWILRHTVDSDIKYTDVSPFYIYSRHPITIVIIQAWGGWASSLSASSTMSFVFLPWVFVLVCCALIVFGVSLSVNNNINLAVVMGYIIVTTPLLEHHGGIGGYAEILVTGSIVSAISFFTVKRINQPTSKVLGTVALALLAIMEKNTGFIYAIAVIGAVSLTYVINDHADRVDASKRAVISFLCFAIVAVALIFIMGRVLWIESESWGLTIYAGGWEMPIELNAVKQVAINMAYAAVTNQSFSLLTLSCIATLPLIIRDGRRSDFPTSAIVFVACYILLCFILVAMLQATTSYTFSYSTPTNDTSGSRMLLPVLPLAILLLSLIPSKVMQHPKITLTTANS